MKSLCFILASILCSATILAQSISSNPDNQLLDHNGNIQLPSQSNPELIKLKLVTNPEMTPEWKSFTAKHGSWTILFDETGLVDKAFGKAIQLHLKNLEEETVVEAGMKFLSENSKLLGIEIYNLALSSFSDHTNKFNIGFKQYYKGLEVVLSKINLNVHHNGNLGSFSAIYYPIPEMDVANPSIKPDEAASFASIGLDFNPSTDESIVDSKLYILPYTLGETTEYRLVYRVEVNISETNANYFAYVDAMNGRILWRQNMTMNAKTSITSTAPVKIKHSREPSVPKNLPDQYITVGSTKYTTDRQGKIDADITDTSNVNIKFDGKWAKVTMKSGPRSTANLSTKLIPGKNLVIDWNDTNSHKFERSLYYHANNIHDYAKDIDSSMGFMDFQLALTIDFSGSSPNAMSGGTAITFIAAGITTMNLSECSSVLYHEYGHSINGLLFKAKGATNGMVNLSCNEGTADLFSCLNLDDPRVGFGAWPSDTNKYIRTLKNKIIYPDSIQADGHYNGQILGGAFWDLREATDLEYVRRLSHFTKYTLPDDPNIGKAFAEWFIGTLNEDDDDGDISNGTPNFMEIVKAFNNHHIGTDLLMTMGFAHNQYADTRETVNPYSLDFKINAISVAGFKPQNVKLLWSVNDFSTTNTVDAESDGNGNYSAVIPAQKAGSIVKYYMAAEDPVTKKQINFYKAGSSSIPFKFLVGFLSVSLNNCETVDGWQATVASDNASRGKWENSKPNQIDMTPYGYSIIQPGQNHTSGGVNCWVTGAKGTSSSYAQYMPNGKTSLLSPVINISNLIKPVIKYYRWFSNAYLYPYPGYETNWKTSISLDSGLSWTLIESRKTPTIQWEAEIIPISKYIDQNTKTIQLKFLFDAPSTTGQPYSLHEGLVDDFEVLAVDESLVGVETQPLFTNTELTITPNPVSDIGQISFTGDASSQVSLGIYDLTGNLVRNLINSAIISGNRIVNWDGSDDLGNKLSGGVYLVRLTSGTNIQTAKLILYR